MLDGNLQPSYSKSMHMLALYGADTHVDWVSIDTSTEGLTALLATLCQETHLHMDKLLSLVCYNSWEWRENVYWEAEDALLPIHYLRRLSLYINIWFISFVDEVRYIELYIMTAIRFYMYRHTFDSPHMISTFFCTPPELALT